MSSPRARPNAASKAAKKNELEKRKLDIAELVLMRIPQFQIAEKLGISTATVSENMRAVRKEWGERHREKVEVIQARELAALDSDESKVRKWLIATTPDQDRARSRYMEILLKIAERRAKIAGLDAPTKIETKVDAVISDRREALAALGADDQRQLAALAAKAYAPRPLVSDALKSTTSAPPNGTNGTNGAAH